MKSNEARQVLRHESFVVAEQVTSKQTTAVTQLVIDTNRSLIVLVMQISDIQVVVTVQACTHHGRRSHHCHAATHHSHIQVWTRDVLSQEELNFRIDPSLWDYISGKLIANDLGVRWTYRFG